MNGGQAVAEVLRREGVDAVFCFPSNPLIDAAAAVGIRPIVGREERTVLNMADAYSRTSNGRKVGVCMVQAGPGAEHAFGGIAQAYSDSVPLLFLPGGSARSRLGLRTTFDAVEAFRPISKWASRFSTAQSVPEQLRRAFAKLRSGRPGPVVLEELPADVVGESFDDELFAYESPLRSRSSADPADVAEAVRILLGASRPVVHAGQGVLWADATEELVAFAELIDAPVMTSYIGKSAFPEDHPLALGAGGTAVSPGIHAILPGADLVFSVGSSLLRSLGSVGIPAGKTIIQATNDPDDLSMEYPLALGLVGDAKLVLAQLVDEVGRQQGGSRSRGSAAEVAEARRRAAEEAAPKWTSGETPINPFSVVAEMISTLDPDETIITHDSGYPRDHLAPNYISTRPRGYLGWGNSTPLGSSLGLALGAKAAAPDKVVVNFMGDAAFGQSGLDVETGVRNHLAIVCVIINNSEMGNYEKMQPVAQEHFDIKRLSGSYAAIAAALGASARRVEHPDEVAPALKEAVEEARAGRTVVLEIITKPEATYLRL